MSALLPRRAVLAGIAALSGCACGCGALAQSQTMTRRIAPEGCVLSSIDATAVADRARTPQDYADTATRSTGNADMDRAFDLALQRLAAILEVTPGFAFYDDFDGENAVATPALLLGVPIGSVFFGTGLFKTLLAEDPSGGGVMWVAAHEFAHILQFQSNVRDLLLQGESTVRRLELHADYMAGYYLGRRKADEPRASLFHAGQSVWGSGDTNYNSPGHHGTPAERVAASEKGFLAALQQGVSRDDAFQAGFDYVMS
ncbi:hypothetical protein [Devosia sp.]|uniref:hypothetical protein n=1 Tax=Devosia sp. TaxID=1871048 RepID=UPI0037BED919